MNEYTFEQLQIGKTEQFTVAITEDKMKSFCELSGDTNLLHTDENFARNYGFSGKVVYGMLTASLISQLGGVYLPGKYCIIQQVETKFVSPVYVGDCLTVVGTVKELHESVKQMVVKVEIHNQLGKKVLRGLLTTGFLE